MYISSTTLRLLRMNGWLFVLIRLFSTRPVFAYLFGLSFRMGISRSLVLDVVSLGCVEAKDYNIGPPLCRQNLSYHKIEIRW